MKQYAKLALTLCVISFIAALYLASVNALTADKIAENEAQKQVAAMRALFPDVAEADFTPDGDSMYKAGDAGYCVITKAQGFGGDISMMVGINTSGTVAGIEVLSHSETAGLGAKATTSEFKSRYANAAPLLSVVKVAGGKDNEIQAITGATITSKAVTKAVNEVYEMLLDRRLVGGGK